MITTALFGCAQDTWCTVHKLRLHGSRICPRCGPRASDGLSEWFDWTKIDGRVLDGHCQTCGYVVCGCPQTKPDSIPLQQAARELTADERQGADREGWQRRDGYSVTLEHESGVIVWRHHDAACVTVHKTDSDLASPSTHQTVLDAQRAAEQLAADRREGWERDEDGDYIYIGPAPGLRSAPIVGFEDGRWRAFDRHARPRVDSSHCSAIAAMLACERALQERDT